MPPKKPDPKDKKNPAGGPLIDDDYSDLPTLPPLTVFTFATLYSFKSKRHLHLVQQQVQSLYSFPAEDTVNCGKYKTIHREEIVTMAKLKGYITEEEAADVGRLGSKWTDVMVKTVADLLLMYEVQARRSKRDTGNMGESNETEMYIWLKECPQTSQEFKTLFSARGSGGVNAVYLLEEKFVQEQEDDFTLRSTDPTM